MAGKLTDAERLTRRTCRRCLTITPGPINKYNYGLCKGCAKGLNDYHTRIPVVVSFTCSVCETSLGDDVPMWCPTCKNFLDDPTECYS